MKRHLKQLGPLAFAEARMAARAVMKCPECGRLSLVGEVGLVCPDGHGRIRLPAELPDEWELEDLAELFPGQVVEHASMASRLRAMKGVSGNGA